MPIAPRSMRRSSILNASSGVKIRVAGHTDERGSDEYNLALGQRRAAAAKRYLTQHGVPDAMIDIISYGEEHPAVDGHDEAAWSKNRRDEFEITAGADALQARRPMIRGVRCLLPLVLLATGACFATREDVQALHADVQTLRADNARSDSARRAALDRVVTSMNIVRDSLGLLSTRVFKMQGDVRGDLYNVGQQLLQIQQLTGQSQQRVQELRASLEARQSDIQSSNARADDRAAHRTGATGRRRRASTGAAAPAPRAGAAARPDRISCSSSRSSSCVADRPVPLARGCKRCCSSIPRPISCRMRSSIWARRTTRRAMRPARIPRMRR